MLFALRQPVTLLGLLLGFVAGCFARALLVQLVISGRRGLHGFTRPGRWLDPFGVVAAVLSGVGWGPRAELGRFGRRRVWPVAGAAVVAHGLLAAAGFVVFVAIGGPRDALPFVSTVSILHGSEIVGSRSNQLVLAFAVENLACAVLCLLPLPPLEVGVAAWSTLPRTPGARRMAYRLLEEQWGTAAVLVLLLLPLAGEQPALLALIGAVANPILHAV